MSKFALPVALLLAGSMWFYIQHVMIGHQATYAATRGIPRGNLSDLYPRWLGARELLLHHRDPYGPEITREIQAGYYGRPIDPTRPDDPKDQQGFAYPVYVVFLLAPTVALPFPVVQVGSCWLLAALTIATVLLWLRTLRWLPSRDHVGVILLLTLGSFQVLQGIKLQQLSLCVSGLIAGCAVLLAEGHLAAAGVLLAWATIKPQLVFPLASWLLLWAASDWRRRKNFVLGFGMTVAALLVASEYVLPGWVQRFRHAITVYRAYNDGAGSVLDLLVTPGWGNAIGCLVLLGLAIACWRQRRMPVDSAPFNWITALILAATLVIAPKAAPYNQVLLIPAILLVLRHWRSLWMENSLRRAVALTSALLVLWPWLAALVLTMASAVLPAQSVQNAWALPLYTNPAIPIVLAALLAMGRKEFTGAVQRG